MKPDPAQPPVRPSLERWWRGSSLVLAAELLLLPTGLITAGFLTRRLGAEGYGLLTLALTMVMWLQWVANSMLARAAQRAVAAATDWRPVAAEVIRLHRQMGLVMSVALLLAAPLVAQVVQQPAITVLLRILSLDLLIHALASGYRNVLIGTNDHRAWALSAAVRWTVRLLAIVGFVGFGWSVTGAALGIATANLAELVVGRVRVGALARAEGDESVRMRAALLSVVAPVAVSAIAMRTFDRADLLLLSVFGTDASTLGYYGAAQNLTVVVSLVATAVSPAVVAAVARLRNSGNEPAAQRVAFDALRMAFLLLPFAALAAGSAPEILGTIYGRAFTAAAPAFSLLMFAAYAMLMVSLSTALLVAADRPWSLVAISVPTLAALGVLALILIPRYGSAGVAAASLVSAAVAAMAALRMATRALRVVLPRRALAIGVLLAVPAYTMAHAWPVAGTWATVTKLALSSVVLALLLLATGELRATFAPPSQPR